MIVLLTAYLKDGLPPPEGDDSEINWRRMEFCYATLLDHLSGSGGGGR